MKIKNKGKVHPSPSSSSSPSLAITYSSGGDVLSVLKLLPAAILTLASILSSEDREVLAYMITRSMKPTTPSSCNTHQNPKKKSPKKPFQNHKNLSPHKPPLFDCDCFDCYTSYWFRWDSSPNRELIHQVIEAFEDHLTKGEKFSSRPTSRNKKVKMGRRFSDKRIDASPEKEAPVPENQVGTHLVEGCENEGLVFVDEENTNGCTGNGEEEVKMEGDAADTAVVVTNAAANNHKGLARKVLPDVLGLLNSRLWNLWSPHV